MKEPLLQLICWTYTFLIVVCVCDGKIEDGLPSKFPEVQVTQKRGLKGDTYAVDEQENVKKSTVADETFVNPQDTTQQDPVSLTVVDTATVEDYQKVEDESDSLRQPQVIHEGQEVPKEVEGATQQGPVSPAVEGQQEERDNQEQPQVTYGNDVIITSTYSAGVNCHYQVGSLFSYSEAYMVQPEQIITSHCNTLTVSYAILDHATFTIRAYSLQEEAVFLRLTERKSEKLKVILEFEIIAYHSNLVNLLTNEENIRIFVSSVVEYLVVFGFDGVQLPALIPDNEEVTDQDYSSIKQGYLYLVKELRKAFDEYGFLLSVSLPRNPEFISLAYDIQEMIHLVDWFNLMSLDYNNNEKFGNLMHTAPLTAETLNSINSVDNSVTNLLRNLNIPPYLIVMALPMYGSAFILQDINKKHFGAEYTDIAPPGPGAHIAGVYILSELCSITNTDRTLDSSIITDYEDVPELIQKILYAKMKLLGGISIMSITMDDASGGLCALGPMPFTAIISKAFNANSNLSCLNSEISLVNYIDPLSTNKYLG